MQSPKLFMSLILILINFQLCYSIHADDRKNEDVRIPTEHEMRMKLIGFRNEKKFKEAEEYLFSIAKRTDKKEIRFRCYGFLISNYVFEGNFVKVIAVGEEMLHTFYSSALLGKKAPVPVDKDVMTNFVMVIFSYTKLGSNLQAKIIEAKARHIIKQYDGNIKDFERLLKSKPYAFNKEKELKNDSIFEKK